MTQEHPLLGGTDHLIGPHAEAPPARLIEADAPVYALVGEVLRKAGTDKDDPFDLLVAPGIVREFDRSFLPVIQFFRVARTEQQAVEWLHWAGAPEGALVELVETGLLARVDTTNPLTAAASFTGVRVIPQSMPGDPEPHQPTLVGVRRGPTSPVEMLAPLELVHVLWGLEEPLDIPTAIDRMAAELGEKSDLIARRVLTNVPRLLRLGLGRLEWVNAPGV